ncbi:MAG TPA: RNA polymerase sigma factor [Candidatus Krumholzibacteria bacterium]|nr:RNA polymerase sigma factor [Candidatus Krumholzibacteria bacterium]HRX51788.1 RNA polymerase sigma factor [Candidatus Krumholzibacteria bacterium]
MKERRESAAAGLSRDVLAGVRRRDPEALGELFEFAFDTVYGLALRMLGRPGLAEDVTQEVFLKVHRAAESVDPDRDPLPWLRTITANLCRDHWRSFGAKVSRAAVAPEHHEDSLGAAPAAPDRDLLAGEREAHVQRALMELPPPLREVVLLREYEGLDYDTIAGMTGATNAAVRKRYSRALAALGDLLGDEWP